MITSMKHWAAALVVVMSVGRLVAAESIGGEAAARAARSVHLKWTVPAVGAAAEVDVFYLEMTVEQSTPGSYFMACGWSGGYFGIQEVRDGKKVVIFSVWDPTKGDDPKAVKPEERVELLHEGEGVRIKRFGGEGTGGQCMADFPWAVGETVRFFVRAEGHAAPGVTGGKTAYAGWVFDPQKKAWRHLVTFRTRNEGKLLRGLYSFVEDFRRDTKSVDDVRRAQFGGGWVRGAAGMWTPLAEARFTASRANWEARDNINAGVSTEGKMFFLATGGATKREQELNGVLPTIKATTQAPGDLPAAVWASSAGAVAK